MNDILELLKEEIYGNLATVYHRSESKNIDKILNNEEWEFERGAGNMYGSGIYTTFSKESSIRNNDYGKYFWKFHIKGIHNFFIFLVPEFNKVYGTNYLNNEEGRQKIISLQNKKFSLNVNSYTDFIKNKDSNMRDNVAGIIFHGNHDGDVCVIWNPKAVIPVAYQEVGSKDFSDENWISAEKNTKYIKKALNSNTRSNNKLLKAPENPRKIVKGWHVDAEDDIIKIKNAVNPKQNYTFDLGGHYGCMIDNYAGTKYESSSREGSKKIKEVLNTLPDHLKKYFVDKEHNENVFGRLTKMGDLDKLQKKYEKQYDKTKETTVNKINNYLSKKGAKRASYEPMINKTPDYWLNHLVKFGKTVESPYEVDGKPSYVIKFIKNFTPSIFDRNNIGTDNGKDEINMTSPFLSKRANSYKEENAKDIIKNLKNKAGNASEYDNYGYRTPAAIVTYFNGVQDFLYRKNSEDRKVNFKEIIGSIPNARFKRYNDIDDNKRNNDDYIEASKDSFRAFLVGGNIDKEDKVEERKTLNSKKDLSDYKQMVARYLDNHGLYNIEIGHDRYLIEPDYTSSFVNLWIRKMHSDTIAIKIDKDFCSWKTVKSKAEFFKKKFHFNGADEDIEIASKKIDVLFKTFAEINKMLAKEGYRNFTAEEERKYEKEQKKNSKFFDY